MPNHAWKTFSQKSKPSHARAPFNQVPNALITRKNSEPFLKDKSSNRNQFSRLCSLSSLQAASPSLNKTNFSNVKPSLLKILSKSTSNISIISSSKFENSSKVTQGERYAKKFSTTGESSGKQVLSRSKSGEFVSTKLAGKSTLDTESDLSYEKVSKTCEDVIANVATHTGKQYNMTPY